MPDEDARNQNLRVCLICNQQFASAIAVCPNDGAQLVSIAPEPMIGAVLVNYEILSIIGRGGMGVVYKARHTLMDRIAAIKMLKPQLVADQVSMQRFKYEAKAASRLNHPHVITIYDFGVSNGQPYIVMDYLNGDSLADLIQRDGQVGVERAIRILTQVCEALEHAHRQGVIHRDIKPTNIVLTKFDDEKDFVKVVDFGVAKLIFSEDQFGQRLTQSGEICGSPVYMSPEQCQGLALDPRADIYSTGVVLYETLTGTLPILGKNMVDTMSKHLNEMPQPLAQVRPDLYIPERVEQVVFKALAKNPADRHQSMDELKKDLEQSIPRPSKSQALRLAPLEPIPSLKPSVKIAMPVWSKVLASIITVLVLLFIAISAWKNKSKTAVILPVQTIENGLPAEVEARDKSILSQPKQQPGSSLEDTGAKESRSLQELKAVPAQMPAGEAQTQRESVPTANLQPGQDGNVQLKSGMNSQAAPQFEHLKPQTARSPRQRLRAAYSSYGSLVSPGELAKLRQNTEEQHRKQTSKVIAKMATAGIIHKKKKTTEEKEKEKENERFHLLQNGKVREQPH